MATKTKFKNTLGDALTGYWTNYFGWGRATRAEYWWCYLFYSILATILVVPFLSILWWLATAIPGFTLSVRRLHDTGRSAWNWLWCLIPIVGWIIILVFLCEKGDKKANKYGPARI